MRALAVTAALLVGVGVVLACGALESAKDEVIPDPFEDIYTIAEAQCAAHPEWPCGHVWMCDTPAPTSLGLVEVCVWNQTPIQTAEEYYGACVPSPDERFHGHPLCWWGCAEGWVGCNAMSGCFCPTEPAP